MRNQSGRKKSRKKKEGGRNYDRIIRMVCGHGRCSLGSEFIELAGGDALVNPHADFLSNEHGITMLRVQAIAQFLEPCRDLIKMNGLLLAISLNHIHVATLL